jgi:hypothetical protein
VLGAALFGGGIVAMLAGFLVADVRRRRVRAGVDEGEAARLY